MTRVGAGASAEVYLADDERLGRRVAVKILHPALAADVTFLRRFQAEARAAAALNHPNLLAVYDWGTDSTPYLVTEYLSGGSLRSILDDHGPLSLAQSLMVGLEAARGLDFAHRRGFVHRDIKPANLLFGEDGRLRVGDFGLARALAEAAWTEPAGTVVGTVRYASPEQVSGERVDGSADVYSLALVLIEAVTGEVPFSGDTAVSTMMGRLKSPVDVPDAMGPLQSVLASAGAIDPVDRPTAKQLGTALFAGAVGLAAPDPLPIAEPVLDPTPSLANPSLSSEAPHESPGERPGQPDLDLRPDRVSSPSDGEPDMTLLAGGGPADADLPDQSRRERRRRRRSGRLLRAVKIGAVVAVFGLAGLVAAVLLRPDAPRTFEVPDLVGSDAESVSRTVKPFGQEMVIRGENSDTVAVGKIIDQSPPEGTLLAEGENIRLTKSLGPPMAEVPTDFEGLPQEELTRRLEEANLALGEVTLEPSEDILADHVIRLDTLDRSLAEGSMVDVVVSTGPAPRIVPDGVLGVTLEEAAALLAEVDLVAVSTEDFSDTVPAGAVISATPPIGSEAARDSEVQLVVSRGVPFFEIPDVIGFDPAAAANALEEAGFTTGDTVGPPNRPVIATDPPAGEFHARGRTVRIITRNS